MTKNLGFNPEKNKKEDCGTERVSSDTNASYA